MITKKCKIEPLGYSNIELPYKLENFDFESKCKFEKLLNYFNKNLNDNQFVLIEYHKTVNEGFIKDGKNLSDLEIKSYENEIHKLLREDCSEI